MSLERIRTGWSRTNAIHAIPATATIVIVTRIGHAPPVIIIVDALVTRFDVIVIEMKGAELMAGVQLTTACLVVSAKTTTATATEMMDVGTICTALRAIMIVSVVILTIVVVIQTGDATVNVMWDALVTRLGVIATEMIDVGTICTALRAILMVSVVTIIAAAVIVTGTAPLATVSVTGS